MDWTLTTVRPWAFLVLAVLMFLTLVWVLVYRNGKGALSVLVAAIVCAFFSDADSFSLFKFSASGGLEARAKTVVQEAENATDDLKKIAVIASEALVSINGSGALGGRGVYGPSAATMDANKEELLAILRGMKVSDADIHRVEAADHRGVAETYENAIVQHLLRRSVENNTACSAPVSLMTPSWYFNKNFTLDIDTVRAFTSKCKPEEQFTSDLLNDYEYYLKTGQQRRPDVWAARDTWYQTAK